MAMIGIRVPDDAARVLHGIEGVPGERVPRHHAHVTLLFLNDGVPLPTLMRAVEAMTKVVEKTQPFVAQTSQISTFTPSDSSKGKVPIICRITSTDLHDLQAALRKALDKAKVPYSKTFPDYKPHTTLSYAEVSEAEPWSDKTIPTVSWGVNEVVLWGGDTGDARLTVTVPMSLKVAAGKKVASLYRFSRRYHERFGC